MIDPTAPLKLPVPEDLIAAHRESWRIRGAHPHKDFLTDIEEPDFHFDVQAIQAAIDSGVVPVRKDAWPTRYAYTAWHLNVADAVVSQGEGGGLDLIWVITLPPLRAAQPVLVLEYREGSSFFDGAHRLARAFVDGAVEHPCLGFERADVLSYRTMRSD